MSDFMPADFIYDNNFKSMMQYSEYLLERVKLFSLHSSWATVLYSFYWSLYFAK